MSHLQYFDYPGFGARVKKETHYSQAVRIGDRIELSGQGGWDRQTEEIPTDQGVEIAQAFANVEHALQQAGGSGFGQVYRLRMFLTRWDDKTLPFLVENLRRHFPDHQPLLTVITVVGLYKTMTIEIEAEAHIKE